METSTQKGKSEVHLKFFEYSNSKRVLIHPDVVTCNKGDKPVFDLWHTSNGDFHTKGKSEVHLKFFEYSNSKRVLIHPDVVTCNKGDKPVCDLIIGTKTMNELGIILDFKHKMITIDEIELPMQSLHKMPTSKRKALALFNGLANQKEPLSMAEATNRVVRILDANYKKANLQEVVNNFWTRYAVRHTVHCQLEQNRELQATPN